MGGQVQQLRVSLYWTDQFTRWLVTVRLIDALRIVNASSNSPRTEAEVCLCTGFTPLHLRTFFLAFLQEASPERRVTCEVGLYGDLVGSLNRAAQSGPTGVAVVVEWADLDARLDFRSLGGWHPRDIGGIVRNAEEAVARIEGALLACARSRPVAVVLPTLSLPPVAWTRAVEGSEFELAMRQVVAQFAMRLAAVDRVRVVSPRYLDARSSPSTRYDAASDLRNGFPYALSHAAVVAELLAVTLAGDRPKKGLITDLDDTLWAGILGEVGADRVTWDLASGSQLHGLYQQLLSSLAESGVLLAVASKNDSVPVGEAMRRRDMILQPDHLFPILANWGPKSESVAQILRQWNVGEDSVVFVDDSPMELAEVQARFPAMECVQFPKDDPAALIRLLGDLRDRFGKHALSDEDAIRRDSLRQASVQHPSLAGSDGTEDFLSRAEAVVSLSFRKDSRSSRPLELINKTNQFNLNGRRLTEAEWLDLLAARDSLVVTASYRDRFGPLGVIAVLVGEARGDTVHISHWVMSCRAFSRRIEHQCLRVIFDTRGASAVNLEFTATPRNGPTQEFLAGLSGQAPADGAVIISRDAFVENCPKLYHQTETS